MSRKRLLGAACVFVAIVTVAYLAMFQGPSERIDRLRLREIALTDEYARKKNYAVNLDLYRNQLREADQTFGVLLHALPDRFEHSIADIVAAGARHRLRLQWIDVESLETRREWLAEFRARFQLSGSYHDVAAFLAETTSLPGTLRIDVLTVDRLDRGQVRFTASLKIHRYLDKAEIAAKPKAKVADVTGAPTMRVLLACLAANCAPEPTDLKQELAERTKDLRGRVDPLPVFKPSSVVIYDARTFADPFDPPTVTEEHRK